jgi:hypothetical protein
MIITNDLNAGIEPLLRRSCKSNIYLTVDKVLYSVCYKTVAFGYCQFVTATDHTVRFLCDTQVYYTA